MKFWTHKLIPSAIGWQSLIGVGPHRPCSHGNYFSFLEGPRCLNMWAENLQHLINEEIIDGHIECLVDSDIKFAVVIDDRVPKDFINKKLCFTGGPGADLEVMKELYDFIGDPDNEFEQFSDPKKYWEDRGWEYIRKEGSPFGILKKNVEAKTRQLRGTFSTSKFTEKSQELISSMTKDVEDQLGVLIEAEKSK